MRFPAKQGIGRITWPEEEEFEEYGDEWEENQEPVRGSSKVVVKIADGERRSEKDMRTKKRKEGRLPDAEKNFGGLRLASRRAEENLLLEASEAVITPTHDFGK